MIGQTVEFIGKNSQGVNETMSGVIMDKVMFFNERTKSVFDHYVVRKISTDSTHNDVKIIAPNLVIYTRK